MRKLWAVLIALFFAVTPDFGRAHLNHADGLSVLVYAVQDGSETPDASTSIGLHVFNGLSNAVTLRGLWLDRHGSVQVEKLRDLLIIKTWQPVKFLRLEPGEELTIAPPRYRIQVPAALWTSDEFTIFADFGPAGRVQAYDPLSSIFQTTP